ncbi:MAG: tryptophan--tRNA ligase [Acidobacteriia bacterium]|nr:tryptophan--tRNA ligase [Terriglobia bacterium]
MTQINPKKRVFSGIQPTGKVHLGNYLGAVKHWVENQSKYDSIFCIVDLHALTIPETVKPNNLKRKILEVAALFMACGIDSQQSAIFTQSHISAHAELTWLLNCVTPVGWLERMTQYKSKADRLTSVSTGLFDYPVLQAADILLYRADGVPVGEDQKQHVELARDIAQRFHSLFGEAFVLPEPMIRSAGARIMGLDDPTVKMSKSLGEVKKGHSIGLTDAPEAIRESILRAVTDSGNEVRYDHASAGVRNLLEIFEVISGKTREEIESKFHGKGYNFLKREVADLVIATLQPIQDQYFRLMADPGHLQRILREGADRVRPTAEETLRHVKRLMGLDALLLWDQPG